MRGDAPQAVRKIAGNGAPWVAVLASMVVGFVAVAGNYLLPEKIFGYLLATSGAVALFVYLAIASSQLVLGRRMHLARTASPLVGVAQSVIAQGGSAGLAAPFRLVRRPAAAGRETRMSDRTTGSVRAGARDGDGGDAQQPAPAGPSVDSTQAIPTTGSLRAQAADAPAVIGPPPGLV